VDAWVADLRRSFATVQLVKPKASRAESREVYAVAREFRGSG
jgi:23S rRNA U2552 (ribose-2'-O)-methylase RlmE/FtsJ